MKVAVGVSGLLWLWDVLRALINSLVCWIWNSTPRYIEKQRCIDGFEGHLQVRTSRFHPLSFVWHKQRTEHSEWLTWSDNTTSTHMAQHCSDSSLAMSQAIFSLPQWRAHLILSGSGVVSSMFLYVHRNHEAYSGRELTSTETMRLIRDGNLCPQKPWGLLGTGTYVHRNHEAYSGRRAQGSQFDWAP